MKFEINGLETQRFSNTFEMNGVTFTVKDLFNSTTLPNGVTTSITNNTNDVFDNIKSFIDKYNALIDKIKGKTSEEYHRSYGPLTDDQKETLTEKQQEKWEEKAKSGLLKRDQTLTSLLGKLRINFSNPVNNSDVNPLYNHLSSIGIKTTSNYLEGGKLVIDEAKLKKAIEEDPSSVENFFRGGTDSTIESQKGIIHRLYDSVNETYNVLKAQAGGLSSTNANFTMGQELTNVDSRITSFEKRLEKVEDRYWKQFTAMEKAIQRANSQSTYLTNMFSTGS